MLIRSNGIVELQIAMVNKQSWMVV